MKINLRNLILRNINRRDKQEECDKKKQIIERLSMDKDTGFNIRKNEWIKKYQEIRKQYREIRVHRLWSTRIGEYIVRYLTIVEDSKKNEEKGFFVFFYVDF